MHFTLFSSQNLILAVSTQVQEIFHGQGPHLKTDERPQYAKPLYEGVKSRKSLRGWNVELGAR